MSAAVHAVAVDAARPVRHLARDRWFVDETYVNVSGVWSYVYRAVDQHGQVIDVYVSQRSPSSMPSHGLRPNNATVPTQVTVGLIYGKKGIAVARPRVRYSPGRRVSVLVTGLSRMEPEAPKV